tara:strand:+ start:73 stop:537 length:465 start_codon:yes stop_codon:yes gene_type:complete
MTFEMKPPTDNNFREIADNVLKKEGFEYDEEFVENYLFNICSKKIYSFLFFLEIKKTTGHDIIKYSELSVDYDIFLHNKSLKKRLYALYTLETLGYSHMDIAMKLYRHLTKLSDNIEYAIELGDAIAHLTKYEHDSYILYSTICKIWRISMANS